MSDLLKDTSGTIDAGLLIFEGECNSLEHLQQQFKDILDHHRFALSLENYDLEDISEPVNPFLDVGLEEARRDSAHTSATQGISNAAVGLLRKGGTALANGSKSAAKGIVRGGAKGTVSLVKAARKFVERMTEFINSVSTAMSKTLATGFPLMGKLQAQAMALKEQAKQATQREDESFELKKASKFLSLGDHIASPDEIIKQLDFIDNIQKQLLDKSKLDRFKEMSERTLEPFRHSIKTSKVDPLVFSMAVLGTLTNPGVVVGVTLKKIFSAANPGVGEVLDKGAKAVGGAMTGGLGHLALAMGTSAGPVLKELSAGRLNISAIPNFQPLYPFCKDKETMKGGLVVQYKSGVLLGNRQWSVKDYTDQLTADVKGSVHKLGSKFEAVGEKIDTNTVKTLSPEQVVEICDRVSNMMVNLRAYCKQWPAYAKTYNTQYRQISDIVMTYEPDAQDEKKSLTVRYIRYSYRNAMNIMLGGIWNNCFGSDNQFIRYLVSLSRTLLIYCQQSMVVAKAEEEDPQDTRRDDS